VDARRERLYFGLYEAAGRKLAGPLLIDAGEAAYLLPDELVTAVGDGATHLAEAAMLRGHRMDAKLPDLQPNAAALAELALEAEETLRTLRPLYLRPPDAKLQAAAAVARR